MFVSVCSTKEHTSVRSFHSLVFSVSARIILLLGQHLRKGRQWMILPPFQNKCRWSLILGRKSVILESSLDMHSKMYSRKNMHSKILIMTASCQSVTAQVSRLPKKNRAISHVTGKTGTRKENHKMVWHQHWPATVVAHTTTVFNKIFLTSSQKGYREGDFF